MLGRWFISIFRLSLAFLLVGTVLLSGCAYATARGRQQIAYAHYVKKYSHNRVKPQTKFKKVKVPKAPPDSQDKVNTSSSEGPKSATSDPGPDNN